jgi:broad specificity phosphatase PhoE
MATGWLPGRLSPTGRKLAGELGRRRRDDGISVVFVSDLARATETARIAFAGSPIPVRADRRLRECDYGALNGAPVAQVAARKLDHIDEPFPGGQSYRQVVDQTRHLLAELAAAWDGHRVLLIAHSANRYALDHLLHGHPLPDLITAPFDWQEGWHYHLPTNWTDS